MTYRKTKYTYIHKGHISTHNSRFTLIYYIYTYIYIPI